MFGMKKKVHKLKYVMLQDGLNNFLNDVCISIIIDENKRTIEFIEEKKHGSTALLSLDKIIKVQTGTRNKIVNNTGTGAAIVGAAIAGTPGAIIGASTGDKSSNLMTLKITYITNDEEKEINVYQTNYGNSTTLQLLKTILDNNIKVDSPKHINL